MNRGGPALAEYQLAEILSCTREELGERLSSQSFEEWIVYLNWKAKKEQEAIDKAKHSDSNSEFE